MAFSVPKNCTVVRRGARQGELYRRLPPIARLSAASLSRVFRSAIKRVGGIAECLLVVVGQRGKRIRLALVIEQRFDDRTNGRGSGRPPPAVCSAKRLPPVDDQSVALGLHDRLRLLELYLALNLSQPWRKPGGFQFATKCVVFVELGQVVEFGY